MNRERIEKEPLVTNECKYEQQRNLLGDTSVKFQVEALTELLRHVQLDGRTRTRKSTLTSLLDCVPQAKYFRQQEKDGAESGNILMLKG